MESDSNDVIVTYQYGLNEHKFDLWLVQNAFKLYKALDEIDQHCRNIAKHGGDQYTEEVRAFCYTIRDMISDGIDINGFDE